MAGKKARLRLNIDAAAAAAKCGISLLAKSLPPKKSCPQVVEVFGAAAHRVYVFKFKRYAICKPRWQKFGRLKIRVSFVAMA